ncbi:MAG TPA: phospholipase D-like domain-containing protein [Gemmataceae bacterium]
MTPQEIDAILRQTLADRNLSGGEKQALLRRLAEEPPDEQQIGFLRHRAFALARETVTDPGSRGVLDWLEEVVKLLAARRWEAGGADTPIPPAEAYFSPEQDCVAALRGLFAQVRRSCDVCVFTITDDRITDAILAAHRRGVRLRLLTDDDKRADLGSDIDRLRAAGVPVRTDRSPYHMHHKFALFDDARLVTGSYNWTRGAAENNEDHFLVTGDPVLVRKFRAAFEKLWDKWGDNG